MFVQEIWGFWLINMSQQHVLAAKKANYIVGCIKHSIANQVEKLIVPLRSASVHPHLK